MIGHLNGMKMIESSAATIQHKEIKRKHRQKRIQKKWLKRYGYIYSSIPDPKIFIFNNSIIGHPVTLRRILEAIEKGEKVNG